MFGTVDHYEIAKTAWTVLAVVVPLLIGMGFGAMALTPAEFRIARGCFAVSCVLFLVVSEHSIAHAPWPFWLRVTAACLAGAVSLIALAGSWVWVSRRQAATGMHVTTSAPASHVSTETQGPPTRTKKEGVRTNFRVNTAQSGALSLLTPAPLLPNIELLEIRRLRLSFSAGSFIHLPGGANVPDNGEGIALVLFNKPRRDPAVGIAIDVRARLTFRRERGLNGSLNIVAGWWLGDNPVYVNIPPAESRELLIVAIKDLDYSERDEAIKQLIAKMGVVPQPLPRKVYAVDGRELLVKRTHPIYTILDGAYVVEVQITVAGIVSHNYQIDLVTAPIPELTNPRPVPHLRPFVS